MPRVRNENTGMFLQLGESGVFLQLRCAVHSPHQNRAVRSARGLETGPQPASTGHAQQHLQVLLEHPTSTKSGPNQEEPEEQKASLQHLSLFMEFIKSPSLNRENQNIRLVKQ
ncbi:hypothetical protein MHYP_G00038060 [Metynnis hypsauchen]